MSLPIVIHRAVTNGLIYMLTFIIIFNLTLSWWEHASSPNFQACSGQCSVPDRVSFWLGWEMPLVGPHEWVQTEVLFAFRIEKFLAVLRSVTKVCSFKRQQRRFFCLFCSSPVLPLDEALPPKCWQIVVGLPLSISSSPMSYWHVCFRGQIRTPVAPSPTLLHSLPTAIWPCVEGPKASLDFLLLGRLWWFSSLKLKIDRPSVIQSHANQYCNMVVYEYIIISSFTYFWMIQTLRFGGEYLEFCEV